MADQITITGNIGQDPELRYTPSGKAVVNFSVGNTPRRLNQSTNQWEDQETTWLRCEAWENLAENIGKSLGKGNRVVVVGELVTESYDDRKTGEKRTNLKLRVSEVGPSLRNATVGQIERSSRAAGGAAPDRAQNNRPSNNEDTPF